MNTLFTSDLHGETRLYHELFDLTRRASAEILILGGDILPSFAPSKRYEDMIPNQKTFLEIPWKAWLTSPRECIGFQTGMN